MRTWRIVPFTVGAQYRVLAIGETWAWNGHGREMRLGEILRFVGSYYSTYDECSAYVFRAEDGGEVLWSLRDDEPMEKWKEVFLPLGKADA